MPFRLMLASSPSFNDGELFKQKLNHYLSQRTNVEIHYLTQRVFTKMCNDYVKEHNHIGKVHQRDFNWEGKETTRECYTRIINLMPDAAIVFWDGETFNEQQLILRLQENNIKHVVVRYKSLKQQLAEEKELPKEKRKKIMVKLSSMAKTRYEKAHMQWFQKQYPSAWADGLYTRPKIPIINSGNRMDFFIVNFIVWSGWSATKVAVMQKIQGKFIASGAKKGTFDVSATIKGKSVKIETKHGADKVSPAQLQMQERERKAGAIAEIVYSIDEFITLYDKIIAEN